MFRCPFCILKGGGIVWTCVKDDSIEKKDDYKAIVLCGFDYELFEEEDSGGVQKLLDGYPYLKHIIQLWPGDWVKQMEKMNEVVGMKNRLTIAGGGKQLVHPFISQEF